MTRSDDDPSAAVLSEISWLRRLARSLVRDDPTADDVVQDACVAAMQGPPPARGKLRGWLAAVARNAARRSHRDRARREGREAAAARPEAVPGAAETAERLETARALLAAVESLDEPYRTAVRLRWLDGLPPREVAARTGVTPDVAWKRLSRGLAMLRARLDRDGGGRRAWLVLVADLGAVEPHDIPLGPLLTTAAATALAPLAIAATAAVLVAGAAVAASLDTWPTEPDSDEARASSSAATTATARPSGAMRSPRPRAADDVTESERRADPAHVAASDAAVATRIVGRVLTPDGAPAVHAQVSVVSERPTATPGAVPTDADGRFALPHAMNGDVRETLVVRTPQWALASLPLPGIEPGATDVGTIRLTQRIALAGRVVDSEGRGVARAAVSIARPEWTPSLATQVVDADGAFRFDETGPGDWRVLVAAPEPVTDWAPMYTKRIVRADATDVRIVLRRRPPGRAELTLEVVDDSGRALQIEVLGLHVISEAPFDRGRDLSAYVTWTNLRTGPVPSIKKLPPGDWTVWVKPTGFAPAAISLHVETWDTSLVRRVVAQRAGRVEVCVTFEGGDAPRGSFVELRPPGYTHPSGDVWTRDGAVAGSALARDDGKYVSDAVAPGTYRLRLHAAGWSIDEPTVDVTPAETTSVRLTARRGGNLNWEPNIPEGAEAEIAFARGDGEFVAWGVVHGTGKPGLLALTAFPPGPLRWRVRVAERDAAAPGEPRELATYEGTCDVVAGGITRMSQGPFAPPAR